MHAGACLHVRWVSPGHTRFRLPNVLIYCAFAAGGVLTLWWEGYLSRINTAMWVYGIAGAVLGFWVAAFELTTRRLVFLVLLAAGGGYLTQYVGATLGGVWRYPPPHDTYYFVPCKFVTASIGAYGLTCCIIGPLVRRHVNVTSRWPNFLLVAGVVVLLVSLSSAYPQVHTRAFWIYYGFMALLALYCAALMNLATLMTLLIVAVLVGAASEIMGARSGLWTFDTPYGWLPPLWLVLGSWPLEVMMHYCGSGLLAGEGLLARPGYFRERLIYEPRPEHPMWTGGRECQVVSMRGEQAIQTLDDVLAVSGFFENLQRRCTASGANREDMLIAIKPNFMFLYSPEDRSTFTDPALVEHLIDRMIERGYRNIAVVEAQSAYGNYFRDREVRNVAKVAGYDPRGRYRIVDLTEEAQYHHFSGPLGHHLVGRTWRDADFRISFAKNKTHAWAWYTLTIKNVYGALAMQDKIREYHYKREIYSPTIDMLVDFPVHFGIIDAWLSADGPFGIFADQTPVETRTILAGENLVALDWAGAEKMGLDPMVSRYMQLAVQAFGKPNVRVVGDAAPYTPWRNVQKPIIDFWDHAEESYVFTNTFFSLLNRRYMSSHFRRRPMTRLHVALSRLLAPLGGLVYKAPRKP